MTTSTQRDDDMDGRMEEGAWAIMLMLLNRHSRLKSKFVLVY